MSLTKEQILAANDAVIEAVEVPEWGGTVHVRNMTGSQRDALELEIVSRPKDKRLSNLRGLVIALCACDETGKALFDVKDAEQIGAKSSKAVDRVYETACRINAIGAKDQDELLKN